MTTRRGRLPAAEVAHRRAEVIEAAFGELVDVGWDKATMLRIAKRAGASKETLYSWFGSRDGLLAAMIQHNADATVARIRPLLDAGDDVLDDPHATLTTFATGLLTLLTGPTSVALNRAAMSSPALAKVLVAEGRDRVAPLVEAYLARLDARGVVSIDDADEAFSLLFGLVVRDDQIAVLLGGVPPTEKVIAARADTAVAQFLALTSA